MPLELSPEDFDLLADHVCRAASGYLAGLDRRASFPVTSGTATAEAFERPLPEQGVGSAVFDDLAVIADHARPGNARFFGYVLGSGEPVAAIADLYASVLNQNVTAWRSVVGEPHGSGYGPRDQGACERGRRPALRGVCLRRGPHVGAEGVGGARRRPR